MPKRNHESEIQINSLLDLLDEEDDGMRQLFAKALNLYVSPSADAMSDSDKLGRLKQAIEQSMQ